MTAAATPINHHNYNKKNRTIVTSVSGDIIRFAAVGFLSVGCTYRLPVPQLTYLASRDAQARPRTSNAANSSEATKGAPARTT